MSMGKLNKTDVEHIAKLSKLNLTSKEIDMFCKQLSDIVGYVNKLKEVDTSKVVPTSQTTGLVNVLREDRLEKDDCLSQSAALSGTKAKYNGYFVVPVVLEEKTIS